MDQLATPEKKVVVGVIVQDGKILIGKHIAEEGHDLENAWHIPGGMLEEGEDPQEGLKREMKEESNLDIEILGTLGEWFHAHKNLRVLWFLCNAKSGLATAGDDLEEIAFVTKDEIYDRCSPQAIASWPAEFQTYLKTA